jgi:uncharacterized protein DUF6493
MSIDPELVREAIARKDAAGVRDLLRGATEADRAACAKALRSLLRDDPALLERLFSPVSMMDLADFMSKLPGLMSGAIQLDDQASTPEAREHAEVVRLRQSAAFLAAALGLAGGVVIAANAAQDYPSYTGTSDAELDVVAGVLADRRPPWLADFVDRHLRLQASFPLGVPAWPLARRLVRLGVIDRPGVPAYTTLMPGALCRPVRTGQHRVGLAPTPAQALLADPGLLEDEVWRLFTVPDAAWEVQRRGGWAPSLVALAEQGHLDRDRLLDACLGAFLRDFAPSRVEWYAQLHDHLEPSLAEMAAHAKTYLALLAANSTPGVRLAQRTTGLLLDADLLDPTWFLAASAPALAFPRKNIVAAQLKLIDKLVRTHPEARDAALTTVAQAFGHERADVQEAALKLIAKHGVPYGPARLEITRLAEALSPSLAGQAARLGLGPAREPEAATGHGEPPAGRGSPAGLADKVGALPAAQAGPLLPALTRARAGEVPTPVPVAPTAGNPLPEPVRDPGALVELFTVLMEDATDALAVERALAGAVRLCHLPQAQRRELAGPLLQRAEAKVAGDHRGPFSGEQITADIAAVVLAWADGWAYQGRHHDFSWWDPRQNFYQSEEPEIMARILTVRAREATAIINGGHPVSLLAEPESDRGAISGQRLAERLTTWYRAYPGKPPARYDLEIALLRLEPGADESCWAEWARLDSVTAARAQRIHAEAQQFPALTPVIGRPSNRYRPDGVHTHVLARTDGGGTTESDSWALLTALTDPLADHFLVYGERYQVSHYDEIVTAWPLLCPWQPELTAAHLLRPLSDGLKPGPSPATTAVGCLAHPGHALGPVGHLALMAGLASAEPDTRIAAAGVWTQACLDGRLDPVLAARAITTGTAGKAFKLNRIADGLQHTASQPIAAYRTVETICLCAPALIEAAEPNLHQLLGLAASLGACAGVPDLPEAIAELAGRRSRTRLATSAALLVEAASRAAPGHAEAVTQALAALVDRAGQGAL